MNRVVRGMIADVVAWYCMPALFLLACVSRSFLPAEAVVPHLRVVLVPLLGLVLFRLVVPARLAAALAASALLALMAAYYALALIGLQSWGRVVSWDLIRSYGAQAPMLPDALDISLPLAVAAAALAWFALLGAAWAYLRVFDWTALLRRSARPPMFALAAGAVGAVGAIELYAFLAAPPTQKSEPLSLTLRPEEGAWDFQQHVIGRLKAAQLDAAEDEARRAYRPAASAERRNVFLIVVDALRPDHMGIYGYARDTTPNLARLEKAGMLRKAGMRASCSSSFCGLLSIAASRSLHEFSVRPITLHEALRRHGYRTHMILSGDHTAFYGLRKAYGELDEYFDARVAGAARYMNDDRIVLERLAAYPRWDGQPVMIQFHLMAAHPLGSREGTAPKYAPAANYAMRRDAAPAGGAAERAVNFYDNGVLHADAVIRGILGTLEAKGYLGNALVAITADHGEALGEHGFYQHTNSVREEMLRIPFVLLSYGTRAAGALDGATLASQVDIAPTILAELGMPRPATWKGAPLHSPVARDFLHFQERWEMGLFDLRDPRNVWKYWINVKTDEEYAFNLTLDPAESRNAIGAAAPRQKRDWRRQVLARGPLDARRRMGDPDEP